MDKVINCSYPTIQHLPGSKMRDRDDKCLNQREVDWLTIRTRLQSDVVIVTEKVDGCNVGVVKKDYQLYPVIRKGYDVITNEYDWIREFANFVSINAERFDCLLKNGERVCGEWMIKTHTLSYRMPHEPFIAFDLINGTERERYLTARERLEYHGFTTAGLVHYGTAIPVEMALKLLQSGFHGVLGQPEGVVYRYETVKNGWLFNAKYVSNPLVGDQELFKNNIESNLMNKWKHYKLHI